MAVIERNCDVTAAQAGRADRVVKELIAGSWTDARGMFDHDCVTLNGAPCPDAGQIVAAGDAIVVRYDPQQRYRERPRVREGGRAYRLVFEDPHLIVVDKSAAVLTVPTERGETNTLLDALSQYVSRQRRNGRAYAVHRLDRGTSGLLVFAKNSKISDDLQSQFRLRKPERVYAAIVAGTDVSAEGTFDSRLATNKDLQRYSTTREEDSEEAVTHYRTVQQLAGATLVQVRLETGRRNQIRVHFADAGHPVLGDERYQPKLARHPQWTARRLALHAEILGFQHPLTGEALRFESPLPPEFGRFLRVTAE